LSITSSEVPESLLPLPSKVITALSGATLVARTATTALWQRLTVVMGNAGWLLLPGFLAVRSPRLIRSAASLILGTKSPYGVGVTPAQRLREAGNAPTTFARYDVCLPQLFRPAKATSVSILFCSEPSQQGLVTSFAWRWHPRGRDRPGKGLMQRNLTGDGKLVPVADSCPSFGRRSDTSDPGGQEAWRTGVVR
jgi:hypothetical protein